MRTAGVALTWLCLREESLRGEAGAGEGLFVDDGREGAIGGCHAPRHAYSHHRPQQRHLPSRQDPGGAEEGEGLYYMITEGLKCNSYLSSGYREK